MELMNMEPQNEPAEPMDPASMPEVVRLRDEQKLTYEAIEKALGMSNANGMNAWRAYRKAKGEASKPVPRKKPEPKPEPAKVEEPKKDEPKPEALRHPQFKTLRQLIALRINALLVGPAGSGKTTAAEQASQDLGLKFYPVSVGPQSTKTDLCGYMDASGTYRRTAFRDAFELGGVLLLDEFDAGSPAVLLSINAALANGCMSFPDGVIKKHADFIAVAAANTFGTGATREYCGRQQLDAATLDRFVSLEWNYDTKLEETLSIQLCDSVEPAHFVQKVRKVISELKIRHIVSPRCTQNLAKMMKAKMDRQEAEAMAIWKGMDPATVAKIKGSL